MYKNVISRDAPIGIFWADTDLNRKLLADADIKHLFISALNNFTEHGLDLINIKLTNIIREAQIKLKQI